MLYFPRKKKTQLKKPFHWAEELKFQPIRKKKRLSRAPKLLALFLSSCWRIAALEIFRSALCVRVE